MLLTLLFYRNVMWPTTDVSLYRHMLTRKPLHYHTSFRWASVCCRYALLTLSSEFAYNSKNNDTCSSHLQKKKKKKLRFELKTKLEILEPMNVFHSNASMSDHGTTYFLLKDIAFYSATNFNECYIQKHLAYWTV